MKYTPDLASEIGMIAGGTGITPMLVSADRKRDCGASIDWLGRIIAFADRRLLKQSG